MVNYWLEQEGLAIKYLDDKDTDVNCIVVKDHIMLNVSFLKTSKDNLIAFGKVGIQSCHEDMQESTNLLLTILIV